jgi:Lamin Tail Domain
MNSRASILSILGLGLGLACSGASGGAEDPDKTAGETNDFAVCGDEMRSGDELCDGSDLGGQQCSDISGFVGGTLGCAADCAAVDTSQCEGDPSAAIVRFNEVTSTEIADGELAGAGDAIELVNIGMAAADLSGLRISDDPAFAVEKTYEFPAGTMLMPGAFVVLTKLDDVTMVGDYPFGISSVDPETLQLADPAGTVLDSVDFVGADATISWCRVPDGDGTWQFCARTFGASNEAGEGDTSTGPASVCGDGVKDGDEDCDGDDLGGLACADVSANFDGGTLSCTPACGLDTTACELSGDSVVVLNEIASSGDDEIELFNAGSRSVDLSGWMLTDDLASPDDRYDPDADLEKLVFADGTVLAVGEYLVVIKGVAPGHPFGLGTDGDNVTLLDAQAEVIDFVGYGANEAVDSYCRIPDGPTGEWQPDCTPSFGATNTP